MNDSQVTEKTDIWSCGVILFILLCGSPPFNSESDEGVFKKIKEGVFNFKSDIWKRISNEAQSLIKQLLQLDYNKRPNAKEVLNHEWFIKNTLENNKKIKELNKELTSNNKYMKKIVFNIKTFRSVKKLQQAALAFIVHNLASREEIQELRNIFYSFDENGDGKLTKEELINGMKEVMTKGEALQNVEAIMSRIDIDKNGYIEYEEFLNAALNRERLLSRDNIKLAFDLFDTDGSGFISKDELKTILGKGRNIDLNDDIWSMLINEIDDNTDGVISFDEFYEMMNKMIEKNV
jgi:calcium-dependent protein kinase